MTDGSARDDAGGADERASDDDSEADAPPADSADGRQTHEGQAGEEQTDEGQMDEGQTDERWTDDVSEGDTPSEDEYSVETSGVDVADDEARGTSTVSADETTATEERQTAPADDGEAAPTPEAETTPTAETATETDEAGETVPNEDAEAISDENAETATDEDVETAPADDPETASAADIEAAPTEDGGSPAGTPRPNLDGAPANVPPDVQKYDRFKKIDGGTYDRANEFLRERTYITAREWAIARLCADFRTETGVEMTKIGENLPELVPFMTDTYTPQAVNQARASFEEKVRKAGATFLYGAMCDFFTAEELDDVMYEATEVAKFLLEVEGVELSVEEELEAEDRISDVMREVREHSAALRHDEIECPDCGHHFEATAAEPADPPEPSDG